MSRPVPLREAQRNQASFGTSREREFYKYLPPYHLNANSFHVGRETQAEEFVARSSSDPVLTAFAQLGALRLDAQRALISLFGRHEQHILTEATRTLSLQDDTNHISRDELWVGSCTMSYDRSFCKVVSSPPQSAQSPSDRVVVVPDLTQDDGFKDSPDVTGYPNIRFLACAPILSPKGIVIGAYTILDDKPHGPLDTALVKFLTDMATTVMNYLDATRSKAQHLRSERMIVGLGSFLEGKGSLRNSWLDTAGGPRTLSVENDHLEGHINQIQQEKQLSDDVTQDMKGHGAHGHLPLLSQTFDTRRDQKTHTRGEQQQLLVSSKHTRKEHGKAQSRQNRPSEASMAAGSEQSRQQSSKDSYTTQVKEAFSRAANIVRESIEVEAVIFFNANFGSQGALVNNAKSDHESSSLESSSGDDAAKAREASPQRENFCTVHSEDSGKDTSNPCRILGFSTSNASSVNNQSPGDKKIAVSEAFLGKLLRRYPQGKIFSFAEDGSISSDDTSDCVYKTFFQRGGDQNSSGHKPRSRGKKYKRTRGAILRQDAKTLLQLAPDSRSIIFTPLWDSLKGRFYSGSLAWTRAPHRVFTSDDELVFLLAFGNSVMAEVHRLDAEFAERAKSDLLAGLSHELRSPLHGIFGTAELLNDTVMDSLQRGFVHTISSCAFTLLGSINQLLEYASIKDVRPNFHASKSPTDHDHHQSPSDGKLAATGQGPQPGTDDVDSYVLLDAVVEDAIETAFAGFCFLNNSRSPLRGVISSTSFGGRPIDFQGGLKVILDVERSQSWKFSTRPGAWHVILTNIFGNSLKFTQHGYIYVSLKADPVKFGKDGEVTQSKVTVTIRDTGCGVDQEFQRNELFTAFSQEDSMSIGNGLGLNIARWTVSSLGGSIHFNSQKGVGTEVVTAITLDHISEPDPPNSPNSRSSLKVTKDLVHDKTIGILGLGSSNLDVTLCSSLQKLCRDWFDMNVRLVVPSDAQFGHCDFYISPHEFLDIGNLEIKPITPGAGERFSSPIIIICSSPRIAHSMFVAERKRGDKEIFEFISQPCGPRKLAKTLDICVSRQQRRIELAESKGGIVERPTGASIPPAPSEYDRESFLNVSNSWSSGQPINLTGNPALRYMERSRQPSDQPNPPRQDPDPPPVPSTVVGIPEAEQFPAKNTERAHQPERSSPMIVLLVDDNEINIRILVAFMKKLGSDYAVAQDGQEALEVFKAHASEIGVILMDISMPIMDGLESTRRIREFEKQFERKDPVSIVALTGLVQADVQREAIGSGMDLFLTKPVQLKMLGPIIEDRRLRYLS